MKVFSNIRTACCGCCGTVWDKELIRKQFLCGPLARKRYTEYECKNLKHKDQLTQEAVYSAVE